MIRRAKWDILKMIMRNAENDMGPDKAWEECEAEEDGLSEDVVQDVYEALDELASKIDKARE